MMRRALAITAIVAIAAGAGFAAVFNMAAHAAVPDRSLDALRAGATVEGFARALQPRQFAFPRDHGPHNEFREEWWYLTGNLMSPSGERFGFELTFFRIALAPPSKEAAPAVSSPWRTHQVYMAHFAITDVPRGRFRFAQKFSRDALRLACAEAAPFQVWLDDWRIGGSPTWSVHAQQQGYELTLDVEALAAPILNGHDGLSVKSGEAGAASYYYSIPSVEVKGQLRRDDVTIPVKGTAWLDREWGSGSLGGDEAGWDWFALQLDDGSALMFYALRSRDGSREKHSAGTWVDTSGVAHELSSTEVQIDTSGHWNSPRGGRYPARWRVKVPSVGLDVEVKPVLANQELGTYPRYWEGAVDASGMRSGSAVQGRGYVELVGYSQDKEP